MTPDDLRRYGHSLLSVVTISSNFYFWKSTDYFSPNADEQPLLHTWSLSIEEQFYLAYPVALLLVWRYGRSLVPMLVAAGALLSLSVWLLLSQRAPQLAFYLAPTRAWELLSGGLLALAMTPGRALLVITDRSLSEGTAALGLVLVLLAVLGDASSHNGSELATVAVVAGTCLLICAAGTRTMVGLLLSSKGLVGIGLVSYSAYLLHQPIFAFLRLADLKPYAVSGKLAVVGLCFGSAFLCWRFVEEPFRSRRLGFRFVLMCVISGVAVAFIGGFALGVSKELRESAVSSLYLKVERSARSSPDRGRCHSSGFHSIPPEQACVYGAGEPALAVFGDSHAVELAYAMGELGIL